MAAGRFVVPPYFPARNRDFDLLSGAKLYVYDNLTTDKANIYTDEALTVLSANPVIANSSGQFPAIWAQAGTEAEPVLYSVSVTTSTGASPGNPFNFDNYRPSVDWETAAAALAEAAAAAAVAEAAAAAVSADEAEVDAIAAAAALAAIEAIIVDAPDAPSVLNKLNRNGDNASAGLLAAIGEQTPSLTAITAPVVDSDILTGYRSGLRRFTASVFADYIKAFFSASGGSALVGFLQAGTGAVARTAQAKARDILSPEDFGAVGDGVADDAPAFQKAINRIAAMGGGTIFLVPGKNYLLNQQINLCDNLCISGYGAKITVGTGFAQLEKPLFKNFSGTQFNAPGTVLADKNIAFLGIEFIGGSVGIPATLIPNADMRGIIICIGGWDSGSGADNVVVQDCNMHDFAGVGVMLWHCTSLNLSNNIFKNFFANVSLSVGCGIDLHKCEGGVIAGNRIDHDSTGLSWHGMALLDWVGPSKNLVVSGNVITNMNYGDGISCEGNAGAGSNGENFILSDNIILDCEGNGIGVDFCISVKMVNNVIRRVIGPGILATSTLEFEAIGNTIEDSELGGIVSRQGTFRAVVVGNDVTDIRYTDANFRGHGIEVTDFSLTAGRHYLVANNRIRNVDGCGIYVFAESGNIDSNLIYNAGRSSSNLDTLRAGVRSNIGMSVNNNDVISTGTTQYGVASGSGDFFNCAGNKFLGTFGISWYHIGYRGTGVNLNLSVSITNLVYDAVANILTGAYNGVPAGYFYRGDTLYETLPAAAGFIGQVVTTTGASPTWKTFGEISP